MPTSTPPIFPLRDAWLTVVPLLPLMLFTGMLSRLIDPTVHLAFLDVTPDHFIARPQREYLHLGDMLTYYSLAAFHTLLCVAVIGVFVDRIADCRHGAATAAGYSLPRSFFCSWLQGFFLSATPTNKCSCNSVSRQPAA